MLLIIKRVELIKKKEFVIIALDLDYKVFIIYITIFNIGFNINDEIYPSKKA